MGDFGDFFSGAASGALTGSAAGPWGALAGGIGGGLMGLLGDKAPELKKQTNPYQGQIDASINRLMSSRVGAQMAQNASAGYRRDARAAFDTIQGNPAVSGNANVMSALYNKAQGTAAEAITDANVKGTQVDQAAHEQGLNAAMGAWKQGGAQTEYNNYVQQMNNRPGPLQQILLQSLSTGAGAGLGKLMSPGEGGGGPPTGTSNIGNGLPSFNPSAGVPQTIGGGGAPSAFQSQNGVPGLSPSSPQPWNPGSVNTGFEGLNFGPTPSGPGPGYFLDQYRR